MGPGDVPSTMNIGFERIKNNEQNKKYSLYFILALPEMVPETGELFEFMAVFRFGRG